jgi:protoporphyrinogen oxidase
LNPVKTKYLIVGAGLAGMSLAYHLKSNYMLVESSDSVGGTAATTYINGFNLENGVHIFYFRDKNIYDLVKNFTGSNLIENRRQCSIWIDDTYVNFPIQYNLVDLSFKQRYNSVLSIFKTLIETKESQNGNFESYSKGIFGNYLTDIFVRPYNEKLFGVSISEINTEWMGDYIPTYSKKKMLFSSIWSTSKSFGRNSIFYYPENGGVSGFSRNLLNDLSSEVIFNCGLENVSLKNQTALLTNGTQINYDFLINTIPLKSFLNKIEDLPEELKESQHKLRYNPTSILHIMSEGKCVNNTQHWIYVPERSIPFYRVTIPGNINPNNCPTGCFALTLEFGSKINDRDKSLSESIAALKTMGLIKKNLNDFDTHWKILEYGYVIYDNNRAMILDKVLPFLSTKQIYSIGRYGQWEYSNMEDAINYGKRTAKFLLQNE